MCAVWVYLVKLMLKFHSCIVILPTFPPHELSRAAYIHKCRVVHRLGQPTGWVGSRFFDFWWVGLGRGSETAETQKIKIFICAEFIEATNVVDTDSHGVIRQISQMFASNCFVNFFSAPVR